MVYTHATVERINLFTSRIYTQSDLYENILLIKQYFKKYLTQICSFHRI